MTYRGSRKYVNARNIVDSNGETAERPITVLVEHPASLVSVLILRVELQELAVFVGLRHERLNEPEVITEKDKLSLWLMRF